MSNHIFGGFSHLISAGDETRSLLKYLQVSSLLNLIVISEVQLQKANAEMAYELQAAKTKQRIKDEQMMIKVVERTQEILVQEQEIQRRERELGEE